MTDQPLLRIALDTLKNRMIEESPRNRVLRVAHLTDVHIEPHGNSPAGLAACLEHIHRLEDPCDFILNGGDSIGDAIEHDEESVEGQWGVWNSVLNDRCKLPIYHCIGNHDVWGLDKERSKTTGNEPLYGKLWPLQQLGLAERYYSFDRAGWHFIVLDSTMPYKNGYTARLDDPQFEWLVEDLAATPATTPVLVLSHIPIFCACAFLDGENEKTGTWVVPGAWMHLDVRRIKDLFYQHPNVKVCLSGHIHLRDCLEYNGVTYLCNGAVCGAWWKGTYQETPPGYALLNLYDDGSFDHRYIGY